MGYRFEVVIEGRISPPHFGNFSYNSACVSATCNPVAALIWSTTVHARDDIVRVGANFKFN
jgi:hypothetical protein